MNASTLLCSLFKCKAKANQGLFADMEQLDPIAHAAGRQAAIRVLNHIYVVDRIFAAHLAGEAHGYSATNTVETPTLENLRQGVTDLDRWYIEYVELLPKDRLSERLSFTFTDGEMGCMSREEVLVHVATHGDYHRGAVDRILIQNSVTPSRDSFAAYLHKWEAEGRARA